MLRQIWALTRKEIKLAAQQPAQWALVMLTPLAFVAVMGSVFGGGGAPTVAVYFVSARMRGAWASRRVEDAPRRRHAGRGSAGTRAEADAAVGEGQRMAAIVIPAGFSAARSPTPAARSR